MKVNIRITSSKLSTGVTAKPICFMKFQGNYNSGVNLCIVIYIVKCLGRAMNNNHKVLSGQEVDVGGTGRYSNMCTLHLKASSLPR